jgi:hypothetical protein
MNKEMLFLQSLNQFIFNIESDHKKHWSNSIHDFKVSYSKGGKYYRIIKNYCGQKSVHSFVDDNGDIWKAAGWKAPNKNFARGNIFTIKQDQEVCQYGF